MSWKQIFAEHLSKRRLIGFIGFELSVFLLSCIDCIAACFDFASVFYIQNWGNALLILGQTGFLICALLPTILIPSMIVILIASYFLKQPHYYIRHYFQAGLLGIFCSLITSSCLDHSVSEDKDFKSFLTASSDANQSVSLELSSTSPPTMMGIQLQALEFRGAIFKGAMWTLDLFTDKHLKGFVIPMCMLYIADSSRRTVRHKNIRETIRRDIKYRLI